jgi:hypothetical protein
VAVYESPGPGRVLIATTGGPLTAEPTWTRVDELATARCPGFDWSRGRQSEFDVTDTGTARVYFHDRDGSIDGDALVGDQIMLQIYDPVAEVWQPVFRGHIDDASDVLVPNWSAISNVQLSCVDAFDYLAGVKFVPGEMGDTPPARTVGVVYYEEGPVGSGELADGRIQRLLDNAGIATSMYVEFSGNVRVNATAYDPDDSILQALRDAADAEFPGIANVYVDRFGRVVFHGRYARFDPDGTSADAGPAAWDFQRWDAATREDVTTGRAQIRSFAYNRPRSRIVNSYVAWPREDVNGDPFDQTLVEGLVATDPTSVTAYGWRGVQAGDLIIQQHKTNGNTGAQECGEFGLFYVANYAVPRKNIQTITFKSIAPSDARAAATWGIFAMDISDIIHLHVDEAGLADEEYYVEGISGECRVLNPDYDMVTVTPNLSPQAYYLNDTFTAT